MQGLLQGQDLSAAYASGDVFMMPSESETLGFVALEAMASGLPVVAVAAGGLTDILTNPGVTGKHVQLWRVDLRQSNLKRHCMEICFNGIDAGVVAVGGCPCTDIVTNPRFTEIVGIWVFS